MNMNRYALILCLGCMFLEAAASHQLQVRRYYKADPLIHMMRQAIDVGSLEAAAIVYQPNIFLNGVASKELMAHAQECARPICRTNMLAADITKNRTRYAIWNFLQKRRDETLCAAIDGNNLDGVQKLLDLDARVEVPVSGKTAFAHALANVKRVYFLPDRQQQVTARRIRTIINTKKHTDFISAVINGNPTAVRSLLNIGASPLALLFSDQRIGQHMTVLQYAEQQAVQAISQATQEGGLPTNYDPLKVWNMISKHSHMRSHFAIQRSLELLAQQAYKTRFFPQQVITQPETGAEDTTWIPIEPVRPLAISMNGNVGSTHSYNTPETTGSSVSQTMHSCLLNDEPPALLATPTAPTTCTVSQSVATTSSVPQATQHKKTPSSKKQIKVVKDEKDISDQAMARFFSRQGKNKLNHTI